MRFHPRHDSALSHLTSLLALGQPVRRNRVEPHRTGTRLSQCVGDIVTE